MDKKYTDVLQPLFVKSKPVVIRTVIDGKITLTEVGPVESKPTVENYVLLSALPENLQQQVKNVVEMIIRGI